MNLPNFLVIGAARSGTTTLHAALARHPDIFMSRQKELRFFAFEPGRSPDWQGPSAALLRSTRIATLENYRACFRNAGPARARGETSPLYLYAEGTAHRVRSAIPDIRLIAVLRHPADRALSHYRHLRALGLEPLTEFGAALAVEDRRHAAGWAPDYHYRRRGYYARQLRPYFEQFPRDRILLLRYDELVSAPRRTLGRIAVHLGLRAQAEHSQPVPHLNATGMQPPPRDWPELRRMLVAEYRASILELTALWQQDLSDWL